MSVKKIKNPARKLMIIMGDPHRKPIRKMIMELIYLALKNKSFPSHYFSRYLYRKEKTNLDDYEKNKILYSLSDKFNDPDYAYILRNKLIFYHFFSHFGFKLPELLLVNNMSYLSMKGKMMVIRNTEDFTRVLLQLFDSHAGLDSIFIKKASGSFGGSNIYKINKAEISNRNLMQELFRSVIKSGYLFQKTIEQHPVISAINPNCINSLRIDTFIDKDGNIDVISAFIRLGLGDSIVDNISSGGCQVGIDVEKATLNKYGYTNISVGYGKVLTSHPDTNVKFENYHLPFFRESLDLVKKAAELIFPVRLIGWDIAITPQGPVLIEGNRKHDMTSTDMALNGCRKSQEFQKILKEAKEIAKIK
ncbi:MAG: hypothetical protein JW723_13900 [Bacteroidales bacterium]|nr:hypothetical protein [Bacteroidales bacterium]